MPWWILIIKVVLIALGTILYRMGGSDDFDKGYRRFGVPACILINTLIMRNWWGILSFPMKMGALSIGYGESSKLMKLLKNKYLVRMTCGLAYTTVDLPILWGNWWLFGWYVIAVTAFVTLNGNQKFKFNAEREELAMGCMITGVPIL